MRTTDILNIPGYEKERSQGWISVFFIFLFLTSSFIVSAQQKRVEGIVTDSTGAPLEKVSVTSDEGGTGTTTDVRGHYSLLAKEGSILSFSYTGYLNQTVTVGNSSIINISLRLVPQTMDAVVVVGYGSQRKVNLS